MRGRMDLKGSLVGKTGCSFHQILFPQDSVRAFQRRVVFLDESTTFLIPLEDQALVWFW